MQDYAKNDKVQQLVFFALIIKNKNPSNTHINIYKYKNPSKQYRYTHISKYMYNWSAKQTLKNCRRSFPYNRVSYMQACAKQEVHEPHHSSEQQFLVIFYFIPYATSILNFEPLSGTQVFGQGLWSALTIKNLHYIVDPCIVIPQTVAL